MRLLKTDVKRFCKKKNGYIDYPKKIQSLLDSFNPESLKPHVFCSIMHGGTILLESKASPQSFKIPFF